LRELEREADNIRGALAWAVANDADVAARLGAALWRWWQANGRYAEGETALERVASVAAPATRTGAETRFGLARLRLRRGKRTEARAAAEASREAFAAAGSAVGEARATDLLGLLAARRGELAAAKALHDGRWRWRGRSAPGGSRRKRSSISARSPTPRATARWPSNATPRRGR
jgi:hypothetical protein